MAVIIADAGVSPIQTPRVDDPKIVADAAGKSDVIELNQMLCSAEFKSVTTRVGNGVVADQMAHPLHRNRGTVAPNIIDVMDPAVDHCIVPATKGHSVARRIRDLAIDQSIMMPAKGDATLFVDHRDGLSTPRMGDVARLEVLDQAMARLVQIKSASLQVDAVDRDP